MDQFIQTLALEFTFRTADPQITSFVRALQRQKPADCVHELDQYMVTRGFKHEKLWKRPSNRLRPQWQQRPQSAQSSATTTFPAIKAEQSVPREKTHTSPIPTQRQAPQTKQPHRLAKYFDKEKGPLCFACKKWGHLSSDCPEKQVFKIDSTRAQPRYVTGEMQKQHIRVQVDSGSQVSLVWSKLVPQPSDNAPKQTIVVIR